METKNVEIVIEDSINLKGISFNKLTLLVGANGTGKSLILKTSYLMASVMNTLHLIHEFELKEEIVIPALQHLFDSVYEDPDFTGHCKVEYESSKGEPTSIDLIYEKGKIKEYICTNIENWERTAVVYMSTEARLFNYMNGLLPALIDMQQLDDVAIYSDRFNAFLLEHRHYNASYVTMWLDAMPFEIPEELKESLRERFDFREEDIPNLIDIDRSEKKVFGLFGPENKRRSLTSFGNGHQSMLNMLITNYIAQQNLNR